MTSLVSKVRLGMQLRYEKNVQYCRISKRTHCVLCIPLWQSSLYTFLLLQQLLKRSSPRLVLAPASWAGRCPWSA
jgi:hypothetical protein